MKIIIITFLVVFFNLVKPRYISEKPNWNPNELLKCLQGDNESEKINELITLLRRKKYISSFNRALLLLAKGDQHVKRCQEYLISNRSVSGSNFFEALGNCLLSFTMNSQLEEKQDGFKSSAKEGKGTLDNSISNECQQFW